MKQLLNTWWNTTNKAYSKLCGVDVTNGNIVTMAAGMMAFLLILGLAKIGEDMIC